MDDSITVLQNVSFINYTTFFFIVEPITSPFIYDFFFKSGCCFSCFYAYFRLGEVELRLGLPRRKKGKKHSPLFFEKKNNEMGFECSTSKIRDYPKSFVHYDNISVN